MRTERYRILSVDALDGSRTPDALVQRYGRPWWHFGVGEPGWYTIKRFCSVAMAENYLRQLNAKANPLSNAQILKEIEIKEMQ